MCQKTWVREESVTLLVAFLSIICQYGCFFGHLFRHLWLWYCFRLCTLTIFILSSNLSSAAMQVNTTHYMYCTCTHNYVHVHLHFSTVHCLFWLNSLIIFLINSIRAHVHCAFVSIQRKTLFPFCTYVCTHCYEWIMTLQITFQLQCAYLCIVEFIPRVIVQSERESC